MKSAAKILYVRDSSEGHRSDYEKLFGTIFSRADVSYTSQRLAFRQIFSKSVLLSSMLEEHPVKFFIIAFTRALIRRRSVSIIFRPEEAVKGSSARIFLKRIFLKLAKRFQDVSIISLIPFEENGLYSEICSDWIYDPQLWDLLYINEPYDEEFAQGILDFANGRRILSAVGRQDATKGFDLFCEIWTANHHFHKDWLFVSAGAVSRELDYQATNFREAGGLLINRHISNCEILSLYHASNVIWCNYAPEYNQASGVFGRAHQHGKIAIVRKDSLLALLAQHIGTASISHEWRSQLLQLPDDEVEFLNHKRQSSETLRDISLSALSNALGVNLDRKLR